MVKVCALSYPKENEPLYQSYYSQFSHDLHDFQKWALQGIIEGAHVLACAPTGTGKSLPAEFSIDFFHSKGKKSIYCSPIKSLSNQKFYDFKLKYPHIDIGLITGDIKTNSNANVLIMTTEILLNKLYQLKSPNIVSSSTSFDMDIINELGCVIFDEIHMINDKDRGHVWENCIMMLPSHVQIVGLSATLDNPEKFAAWLEGSREVYLTQKFERPVPLIHYTFLTTNSSAFKTIKDKSIQAEIREVIDKPFVIQSPEGEFNDAHFQKMTKIQTIFRKHEIRIKRHHVINQVSKYLVEYEMLPALCYVFSRKKLETCANEITTNLLEFDSKIPYTIDYECEQIIRKLPNFKEYLHLPEYLHLVSLLQKGVGIHHAGMMSVLREIVEILFAKGKIKMLFCTTSVAIGLNLPVRTCIFTDIMKHDGDDFNVMQGHEYTQAAGRAGRLGLDKVGHVIHLNNLFEVGSITYRNMMKGKPQLLVSKFKVSYNLILNLIDIGDDNILGFAKKSMIQADLEKQLYHVNQSVAKLENELLSLEEYIKVLKTPKEIVRRYIDIQRCLPLSVNKKKRELIKESEDILSEFKFVEMDKNTYSKYEDKLNELNKAKADQENTVKYVDSNVHFVLEMLTDELFIDCEKKLTLRGRIACQLREVHCLVFAKLIESNAFDSFTSVQLVSLFSCFTSITLGNDDMESKPCCSGSNEMSLFIQKVKDMYDDFMYKEVHLSLGTGVDYSMHYDLLGYVDEWCVCQSVEDCKYFLEKLEREKGIFLGEFVKALLKINNISSEFEKVAEMIGNIALLSKLKQIPEITLKYVVTNQSLYV